MKPVFKIALIESELHWGRKIDDWMVTLTYNSAIEFQKEFNSKNISKTVPDYYLQIWGEPEVFYISDEEFQTILNTDNHRIWLSILKNI